MQVLGTGDLLTQIARCCNPVPGDAIIGYVTRSRGVTVHRADCHNVLNEDEKERLVDVEWGARGELYPVAVHIEAWDRVGLLRDLSTIVVGREGQHDRRPHGARRDRTTHVYLTLETTGIAQLSRLMAKLESVRGVITVNRQLDGTRRAGGRYKAACARAMRPYSALISSTGKFDECSTSSATLAQHQPVDAASGMRGHRDRIRFDVVRGSSHICFPVVPADEVQRPYAGGRTCAATRSRYACALIRQHRAYRRLGGPFPIAPRSLHSAFTASTTRRT